MDSKILVLAVLGIVLISGCVQQSGQGTVKQYVCPDGSTVSDSNLCPKVETSSIATSTTTTKPIYSIDEAIDILSKNEKANSAWEGAAKYTNCGVNYLQIKNAIIHAARITESKNFIECQKRNNYNKFVSNLNERVSNEFSLIDKCDKRVIEVYSKAIRGYEEFAPILPISEYCSSCDDYYVFIMGCVGDKRIEGVYYSSALGDTNISEYAWAVAVVDVSTGKVYFG